ncbi:CU044_5270 family protein [Micromonospora sp. NPDC047707]|uniref:CU044_5270 family protein n=1 Tax=Micromonospora sp. NPDC047707 TaxID=3154498 RepID=UPI003452AA1B
MSRPRDVLDLLARSRPARLDPPDRTDHYTRAVSTILDSQTPADVRSRPHLGRTRRAAFMSVGVTAAVAAAVVAGVAVAPHVTAPGPAATSAPQAASASQLLLAAAERSAATPLTGGRYLNLHTEFGFAVPVAAGTGSYTMFERSLSQYWLARSGTDQSWVMTQSLGITPATSDDEAAWRRAGSPSVVRVTKPKPAELRTTPGKVHGNTVDPAHLFALGDRNVSQAQLDALPTDPAALRGALLSRFDGGGSDMPTDRDQWLFTVAASVVIDLPVSNEVRAAAYRMLAELPGVRALGTVRDVRGRAGQAVAYVEDSPGIGRFEVRLIINPDTGQALGKEMRAVEPRGHWSWIEPGAISTYQLVLVSKTTDYNPPKVDVTN